MADHLYNQSVEPSKGFQHHSIVFHTTKNDFIAIPHVVSFILVTALRLGHLDTILTLKSELCPYPKYAWFRFSVSVPHNSHVNNVLFISKYHTGAGAFAYL